MWRICSARTHVTHYRSPCQAHIGRHVATERRTTQCRKCGVLLAANDVLCFFCKMCHWPVESSQLAQFNAFEIFKIPQSYRIDRAQLNKQYKAFQFELHPDRHAAKQHEEIELINSNASVVNGYYRALLDDKQRAKMLFCLKYGEEEFSSGLERTDPAQLEEIMEVHEKVDTLQNPEEAKQMQQHFERILANAVQALETAFNSEDKHALITHFKTLSFYTQLLDKIRDIAGIKQ